jgi:preprotein translocase subunit SecE
MSMNREQKRQLQRMGAVNEQGVPVRDKTRTPAPRAERTNPVQFVREVRAELRKVAWPTRDEVRNYSIIVLIAVVLVTALVAGLDWVFGSGVLWLYKR